MVAHGSAQLVPFVRDHLFASVHDSCRHRPTSIDDASALTQTIVTELMKKQDGGIIARDDIARTARDILQRFDKAAATFYAAYHPAPENEKV
jgi:transcriptional regulator NrdR family protein